MFADVSGKPSGPIFKQSSIPWTNNYKHTLRNNPEERRPHLHGVESLKSRKPLILYNLSPTCTNPPGPLSRGLHIYMHKKFVDVCNSDSFYTVFDLLYKLNAHYQLHMSVKTRSCDMFRYKFTIFRESNMPGLKPTAIHKLLFKRCTFSSRLRPLFTVQQVNIALTNLPLTTRI